MLPYPKRLFAGMTLLISFHCGHAQNLVSVLSETLTVNSKTSLGGDSRNITIVSLPPGTQNYIYRITILPKGKSFASAALFSVLQQIPRQEIQLSATLAKMAIENNDNDAVDAYVFTNFYDAERFKKKDDGKWDACQTLSNVSNSCRSIEGCMGSYLYFGFKNNNIVKGLDIKLEIVAVVSPTNKKYKFTYSLSNGTDNEQRYYQSTNNRKWEWTTLRGRCIRYITQESNQLYLRVYTTPTRFKAVTVYPNDRYELYYDEKKKSFDFSKY